MAPKSRGTITLFDSIVNPSRKHICRPCRRQLLQTRHASTATAESPIQAPSISQVSPNEPGASAVTQPRIVVKAGVVLSRPPLITPDPHPFDTAFYLYQRRLNERLVLPFTQYFHYKRGTPAFEIWRSKRRARGGTAARDIGDYNAYTKESWNDEVLVGDRTAEPHEIVEKLIDEEGRGSEFVGNDSEADTKLGGLKRTTPADQQNDQKSLDRSLSRTLYLLVRNKPQSKDADVATSWRFPSHDVQGKDGLKETAERALSASCGVNMNTWFVASHPIGHHIETPVDAERKSATYEAQTSNLDSEKTFFLKARIFAGQADLAENTHGVEEFKWLAKEEIEKHVTSEYWSSIKNMLIEQ